jgi:hypothetical protein
MIVLACALVLAAVIVLAMPATRKNSMRRAG